MESDTRWTGMPHRCLTAVRRHPWSVLGLSVMGMFLGLLLGLGTQPLYRARLELEIQPSNATIPPFPSMTSTSDDAGSGSKSYLPSQVKLLSSDLLTHATTERMLQEPHPAVMEREDLLSRLRRAFHLGYAPSIPYSAALAQAERGVKVLPVEGTRLVGITCEALSPNLAATFCNELGHMYQESNLPAGSAEALTTKEGIVPQFAGAKQRTQETGKQADTLTDGKGMQLNPNSGVDEDRLRALQDELTKAQAERITKEAETRNTRLGDSSVARKNEELALVRHRETLLKFSYSAELSKVSADLQRAAKTNLLHSEMDANDQRYRTMPQQAKEARFASLTQATVVRVVEPATAPAAPFSPKRTLAAAAGLLAGGMLGTAFAFYRERTRKLNRTPDNAWHDHACA